MQLLHIVAKCVYLPLLNNNNMNKIKTQRISPTVPVELVPEILAFIAKRVAEFKAKSKEDKL